MDSDLVSVKNLNKPPYKGRLSPFGLSSNIFVKCYAYE